MKVLWYLYKTNIIVHIIKVWYMYDTHKWICDYVLN